MEVIYGLIPGMVIMGLVAVAIFFWAAKSGQFDDMQGEANRILMDDDLDEVEPGVAPDKTADETVELSAEATIPDTDRAAATELDQRSDR